MKKNQNAKMKKKSPTKIITGTMIFLTIYLEEKTSNFSKYIGNF